MGSFLSSPNKITVASLDSGKMRFGQEAGEEGLELTLCWLNEVGRSETTRGPFLSRWSFGAGSLLGSLPAEGGYVNGSGTWFPHIPRVSEKITSVAPRVSWLGGGGVETDMGTTVKIIESEAVTTWTTVRTKENKGEHGLGHRDPMKLGRQHQVPDPTLHCLGPMKTLPSNNLRMELTGRL